VITNDSLHVRDHPRSVIIVVIELRGDLAQRLRDQGVVTKPLELCRDSGDPIGILLEAVVNVVGVLRAPWRSIMQREAFHRQERDDSSHPDLDAA